MIARALLLLGVLTACFGCSDDLPSFFDIEKFRLLGLSATPPTIRQDESATLSALVTEADAEYQWTWCPLSSGTFGAFECAITEEELQALIDEAVGAGVITVPPYDLGTGATATWTFDLPAAGFSAFCDFLLESGADLPEGADFPDCEEGYDLQIRLDTRLGDESVTGVRDLRLLLDDDDQANNNPSILGARAVELDDQGEEVGGDIVVDADVPAQLERDKVYKFFIDVPASDAEPFFEVPVGGTEPVERLDDLTVAWFREGGEFDKNRTGFIDGTSEFELLLENEFTTPTAEDYEDGQLRLFWTIRDNRGGTGFFQRTIELVEP
ncbi:MAG: hypothetical protein KJO07_14405 [Deltaproteobacteria bacterium]|jgi:hypothetical protein|nr:hypothetical protein [Deltaproteobacteria bacterium]